MYMAKEEAGRFPEARNTGIAGTGRSTGHPESAPGSGSTGTGSPALTPAPRRPLAAGWHRACLTARRFQTPPESTFQCFQPAFLTSNL